MPRRSDAQRVRDVFSAAREGARKVVDFLETKRKDGVVPDRDVFARHTQKLVETLVHAMKDALPRDWTQQVYLSATYTSVLFEKRLAFYDTLDTKSSSTTWTLRSLNEFYVNGLRGPGISTVLLRENVHLRPWYRIHFSDTAKLHPLGDAKNVLQVPTAGLSVQDIALPSRQGTNAFGASKAIALILQSILKSSLYDAQPKDVVMALDQWLYEKRGSTDEIESDETIEFRCQQRLLSVCRPLQWFYLVIQESVPLSDAYFFIARMNRQPWGALLALGASPKVSPPAGRRLERYLWFFRALCSDVFLPIVEREQAILSELRDEVEEEKHKPAESHVFERPSCKAMVEFCEEVERYAPGKKALFLAGERGTGKSTVAKYVHERFCASRKEEGPFISVSCATLRDETFEQDMCGSEKQKGYFTRAHKGTLFLDEVATLAKGDNAVAIQNKLLIVLQEKRYTPYGSDRQLRSSFRLLTATWEPLDGIRRDLIDRFYNCQIRVPSLRERFVKSPEAAEGEDEEYRLLLVNCFSASTDLNWFVCGAEEEVVRKLREFPWPGNVREFENTIYAAVARARHDRSGILRPEHLKLPLLNAAS